MYWQEISIDPQTFGHIWCIIMSIPRWLLVVSELITNLNDLFIDLLCLSCYNVFFIDVLQEGPDWLTFEDWVLLKVSTVVYPLPSYLSQTAWVDTAVYHRIIWHIWSLQISENECSNSQLVAPNWTLQGFPPIDDSYITSSADHFTVTAASNSVSLTVTFKAWTTSVCVTLHFVYTKSWVNPV